MSTKKNVLYGLTAVLVVGGGLVYSVDFGGSLVATKAAEFIAKEYNLGVSIDNVKGNPFRGYRLEGLKLTRNESSLVEAGSLILEPAILKMLSGTVALNWAEMKDVKTTFSKLRELAEVVSATKLPPLPNFLPTGELELRSLGGTLDGSEARGEMDVVVAGFPVKGKAEANLGDVASIRNASFQLAGGTLDFSGKVKPEFDLKAKAANINLGQLGQVIPALMTGIVKGVVSAEAHLMGPVEKLSARGKVTFADGQVAALPVSLESDLVFDGTRLVADPMTLMAAGIPLAGSLRMNVTGQQPIVDVALKTSGPVSADVLHNNVPQLPADLKGQVESAALILKGPVTALEGVLEAQATSLSTTGITVTDNKVSVKFNSSGVVAFNGHSAVAGSPLTLSGQVHLMGSQAVDLKISTQSFDLSRLHGLFTQVPADLKGLASGHVSMTGSLSQPRVGGVISSPKVQFFGFETTNVNVPFSYGDNVVTLHDASSQFMKGMIGTSGRIDVKAQNLDFNAKAVAMPLKGLVPGVIVSGTADLEAHITGPLSAPEVKLNGSSNALGTPFATLKGVDVSTALKLTGTMPSTLDAQVKAQGIETPFVKFTDASTHVMLKDSQLDLSNLSAKLGGAPVTGNFSLNLKDWAMKGALSVRGAALDNVSPMMAGMVKGTADADVTLSGTINNPAYSVSLSSPKTTLAGAVLDALTLKAEGTADHLSIPSAQATFGGAQLQASGSYNLKTLDSGEFSVSTADADLAAALAGLAGSGNFKISGKATASLSGKFVKDGVSGSGSVTTTGLNVAGFVFDDARSSLVLKGTKLQLPDLTSGFYGGRLSAPLVLDFEKASFAVTVTGEGADLARIMAAAMPDLKGALTGTLKAQYQGNGSWAPFSLKGSGSVSSGGGELKGFKWLDIVAVLHGEKRLTYASAVIPFDTSTTALTLKEGSKMVAHEGDKLYRFLKAQGPMNYAGTLNLNINANLNALLINGLFGAGVGGVQGLALGAAAGGDGALGGALVGLVTGFTEGSKANDFRDVSLTLTGPMDNPSVKNLKVGASTHKQEQRESLTPADSGVETPVTDQLDQKVKEVLGGLSPQKPEAPQVDPSTQPQPESQPKPLVPPSAEDQLKDALKEGLKGLFK